MTSRARVRAAGGVIVRRTNGSEPELLLIHRPRRNDWTFPKGKIESGETDEACALREVEEETGLRCEFESELPTTAHITGKGRLKEVALLADAAGRRRGRPAQRGGRRSLGPTGPRREDAHVSARPGSAREFTG